MGSLAESLRAQEDRHQSCQAASSQGRPSFQGVKGCQTNGGGTVTECPSLVGSQINPTGQSLQLVCPIAAESLSGSDMTKSGTKGSKGDGSQVVVDNLSWTIESPSSAWSTSTDASHWPLQASRNWCVKCNAFKVGCSGPPEIDDDSERGNMFVNSRVEPAADGAAPKNVAEGGPGRAGMSTGAFNTAEKGTKCNPCLNSNNRCDGMSNNPSHKRGSGYERELTSAGEGGRKMSNNRVACLKNEGGRGRCSRVDRSDMAGCGRTERHDPVECGRPNEKAQSHRKDHGDSRNLKRDAAILHGRDTTKVEPSCKAKKKCTRWNEGMEGAPEQSCQARRQCQPGNEADGSSQPCQNWMDQSARQNECQRVQGQTRGDQSQRQGDWQSRQTSTSYQGKCQDADGSTPYNTEGSCNQWLTPYDNRQGGPNTRDAGSDLTRNVQDQKRDQINKCTDQWENQGACGDPSLNADTKHPSEKSRIQRCGKSRRSFKTRKSASNVSDNQCIEGRPSGHLGDLKGTQQGDCAGSETSLHGDFKGKSQGGMVSGSLNNLKAKAVGDLVSTRDSVSLASTQGGTRGSKRPVDRQVSEDRACSCGKTGCGKKMRK